MQIRTCFNQFCWDDDSNYKFRLDFLIRIGLDYDLDWLESSSEFNPLSLEEGVWVGVWVMMVKKINYRCY